jgi:hypothetical protein
MIEEDVVNVIDARDLSEEIYIYTEIDSAFETVGYYVVITNENASTPHGDPRFYLHLIDELGEIEKTLGPFNDAPLKEYIEFIQKAMHELS